MTRESELRPRLDGVVCEHCGQGAASADGQALRCTCGSLLARYVGGRLELKCRRCKRTVTVSAVPQGLLDLE